MKQLIYEKFKFKLRNTSLKKELGGGLITFFTMIYILPVNASILSDDGNGIPYGGVLVATVVVSAMGSFLVGIFSNLPIAVAPGMGANVFFVTTMMGQFHLNWQLSLAAIIISSVITTILIIIGVVEKLIKSIPTPIKHALIIGLGVYLAYIGLKNSEIIIIKDGDMMLGDLSQISVILALFGIFMVFALLIMKFKMAIIYTLLSLAILGLIIGQIVPNKDAVGLSSFDDINFNYNHFNDFNRVFGKGLIAIPQAFSNVWIYPSILALIFMMLNGASGTIISIGETTNLKDIDGKVEGSKQATLSIALTSISGGILGTSTASGYIESNAGAKYGARTGIASIFTAFLFILSIPLFPVLQLLFTKKFVTAPALVFVGLMMIENIKKINWSDPVASASSFILFSIMWFTASIINGLAFGLVAYIIFELARGNYKQINIYTYIFGFLFLSYIISISFII